VVLADDSLPPVKANKPGAVSIVAQASDNALSNVSGTSILTDVLQL